MRIPKLQRVWPWNLGVLCLCWLALPSEVDVESLKPQFLGVSLVGFLTLVFSQRHWRLIGAALSILGIFAMLGENDRVAQGKTRRETMAQRFCFSNQEQIRRVKITWALEQHKATNDVPDLTELVG